MRTLFGHSGTAFLVQDAVVQDLPHQTTEPVRNRADGLRVSQADDQAAVHERKDTAFGLDGGVGRLIERRI